MTTPRKYGYIRGHLDKRDKLFAPRRFIVLPDVVDLRGDERMPPVWDQGSQGSCVAHGVGALAAWNLRAQGKMWTPSRSHLYYEARARRGWQASDTGSYVRDGVKVLAQEGCLDERAMMYDDRLWTLEPSEPMQDQALENRVTGYARVEQDSYSLRAALADGHPIVFGFTVFESFEDVGSDGIVPQPAHGEAPLGGHCAVVVGYDIRPRAGWLVRNSWDDGWGIGGYCWMPFDYVLDPELCADFTIVGLA